jgi:hypothetical protein
MIIKKTLLYLDDIRTPIMKYWKVIRNYKDFVAYVNLYGLDSIEAVSLDHDLGEEGFTEKTGYDAAKFLIDISIEKEIKLPQIYVHSANPIGSNNIVAYVNNYLKSCGLSQNCKRIIIDHK